MSAALNTVPTYDDLLARIAELEAKLAAWELASNTLRVAVARSAERSRLIRDQAEIMEDARVQRYRMERDEFRQRAIAADLKAMRLEDELRAERTAHRLLLASIDAHRRDKGND